MTAQTEKVLLDQTPTKLAAPKSRPNVRKLLKSRTRNEPLDNCDPLLSSLDDGAFNQLSWYAIQRRLALRRKKTGNVHRSRLTPAYNKCIYFRGTTVAAPPGALPEQTIVWARIDASTPAQPESVRKTSPWHLAKIVYCRPAQGFCLGYLHRSGEPENVKKYLVEWVVGHPPAPKGIPINPTGMRPDTRLKERNDVNESEDTLSPPEPTINSPTADSVRNVAKIAPSQGGFSKDTYPPELNFIPSALEKIDAANKKARTYVEQDPIACSPWQFEYYVHFQGYNRRYDKWCTMKDLLPATLHPDTAKPSSKAMARHLSSAFHTIPHPIIGINAKPDAPSNVYEYSSSVENAASLITLHLLRILLPVHTLSHSVAPRLNKITLEVQNSTPILQKFFQWWINYFGSGKGKPISLITCPMKLSQIWWSIVLFGYMQLDLLDVLAAAHANSKKKKRNGASAVGLVNYLNTLAPSHNVLQALQGLSSLSSGKLRELQYTTGEFETGNMQNGLSNNCAIALGFPTVQFPDYLKNLLTELCQVILTRGGNEGSVKNISCIDAYSDVVSDAGEHEGMDIASIEAHESMTKIRTIENLQINDFVVPVWYYSPLPAYSHPCNTLYVCAGCLRFHTTESELRLHEALCARFTPPGDEIYRHGKLSFYEVDGETEWEYCENLSLMSKLFLDHKTLQFNVAPFLFYVLIEWNNDISDSYSVSDLVWTAGFGTVRNCQIVGYFSKEKCSAMGYNLACILTLPQHQRKGYGKFFINFSYSLSKIEQKVGTPERPLSDLGRVSYTQYWKLILTDLLLAPASCPPVCACFFAEVASTLSVGLCKKGICPAQQEKDEYDKVLGEVNITIADICHYTSIRAEDVIATLKTIGILSKSPSGDYVIMFDKEKVLNIRKSCGRLPDPILPEFFVWSPKSSLQYSNDEPTIQAKSFQTAPHNLEQGTEARSYHFPSHNQCAHQFDI